MRWLLALVVLVVLFSFLRPRRSIDRASRFPNQPSTARPSASSPDHSRQRESISDLDEWVRKQKKEFGVRSKRSSEWEREAAQFNPASLGLSGIIVDKCLHDLPPLIPFRVWGGELGWRSDKRRTRWETLLQRNGIAISAAQVGILLRFRIDALVWVPHPYAPPHWAMLDFDRFSSYVVKSEEAFNLCKQWRAENATFLQRRLTSRFQDIPIQFASDFRSYDGTDFAEVAFQLQPDRNDLLFVKTVWRQETALAELVRRHFPDAIREYSPGWLLGQRIDVFVPSLNIGFEYHGEQHYHAVEFFGGKKGFRAAKDRDQRKASACQKAGITLIEWKYTEGISATRLAQKLREAGIELPAAVGQRESP